MGNLQTGEGKHPSSKASKSPSKVKSFMKIRGKKGKLDTAQLAKLTAEEHEALEAPSNSEFVPTKTPVEVKNESLDTDSWCQIENKAPSSAVSSSSGSNYMDPLTPMGFSTEINQCYYSEESVDLDVDVQNSTHDNYLLTLNNFKLHNHKFRQEEEKTKKLSKLGLSKISQISLDSDPKECFTTENIEIVNQQECDDGTLKRKTQQDAEKTRQVNDQREYKRHMSTPSEDTMAEGQVLKKVTSLTFGRLELDSRISKPKFVPEKLDFQLYDKFEGHMLVNWFVSEIGEDHPILPLNNVQDLKLLATQFATHLLAAGILLQLPDKDVPMHNIFKPDCIYYWAHAETPMSVPQTPGRLSMVSWPPVSPSEVYLSTNDSEHHLTPLTPVDVQETHQFTDKMEFKNSARDVEILSLEEEIKRLKQQVEKYKTVIEIQNLTAKAVNDFSSPTDEEKLFKKACDNSTHKAVQTDNNAVDFIRKWSINSSSTQTLAKIVHEKSTNTELNTDLMAAIEQSINQNIGGETLRIASTLQIDVPDKKKKNSLQSMYVSVPSESETILLPQVPFPSKDPDDLEINKPLIFLPQNRKGPTAPPPPPPPPSQPPTPPLAPMLFPSATPQNTIIIPPPPPLPTSTGIPPPPPLPSHSLSKGLPQPAAPPPPPPLPVIPTVPSSVGAVFTAAVGSPVPLPPPPLGGWNSQKNGLRKPALNPSVPMKPLYWTRIVASTTTDADKSLPSTVSPLWTQIDELPLDNLNEFSDLFSRQVSARKPIVKKKEEKNKINAVKLLNSKRSQNVGILAQSLHVDFHEIENAIYHFDTSIVNLEALQQIYEVRASQEELELIKSHLATNPKVPLDKPEQFLYELSEISNFAERISCLMFQIEFEDSITTIDHTLTNIKTTCKYLVESSDLKQIFAIILTLGNYMNGGNMSRGQADGFGLEILSKLKDVKSKDSKITLLHYIVKIYLNKIENPLQPNIALPVPEPGDIKRAASVDFDQVHTKLKELEKQLGECEMKVNKVIAASIPENLQPFQEKMISFLENSRKQITNEYGNLDECKSRFITTMIYYVFKPKTGTLETFSPNSFFELWLPFCTDFKDIFKKELIRLESEKIQEIKKKERDRLSEILIGKEKENGLKAKIRRLQEKRAKKINN